MSEQEITKDKQVSEAASVGKKFFEAQDRLRGGPDEALCTIDYTAEINGNSLDLDGHRAFAAAFYGAFPDLRHEFDSVEVREGAERLRLRLLGTHEAEFMGIAATGRAIEVSIDAILLVEDGRVESLVGAFDQGDFMRQLGA
jgi:predicted ester cyclase